MLEVPPVLARELWLEWLVGLEDGELERRKTAPGRRSWFEKSRWIWIRPSRPSVTEPGRPNLGCRRRQVVSPRAARCGSSNRS